MDLPFLVLDWFTSWRTCFLLHCLAQTFSSARCLQGAAFSSLFATYFIQLLTGAAVAHPGAPDTVGLHPRPGHSYPHHLLTAGHIYTGSPPGLVIYRTSHLTFILRNWMEPPWPKPYTQVHQIHRERGLS